MFCDRHTVESSEFTVAEFAWYLWAAVPQELTPSTISNLERVLFLTETENRLICEITSLRISKKKPHNPQKLPPPPPIFKGFHGRIIIHTLFQ